MAHGGVVHHIVIHRHFVLHRHVMPHHVMVHWHLVRGRQDGYDLHHAGIHVVEQVAVKGPVADMFCRNVNAQLFCGFDDHGYAARLDSLPR